MSQSKRLAELEIAEIERVADAWDVLVGATAAIILHLIDIKVDTYASLRDAMASAAAAGTLTNADLVNMVNTAYEAGDVPDPLRERFEAGCAAVMNAQRRNPRAFDAYAKIPATTPTPAQHG